MPWRLRAISCAVLISLVSAASAHVPVAEDDANGEVERLMSLAKVWATVTRSHPYLAYRPDIDWDEALLAAIPRVRRARTAVEFESALDSLLSVLGDPTSRLIHGPSVGRQKATHPRLATHSLTDGTLLISTGDYTVPTDYRALLSALKAAANELPNARAVIVDLRSDSVLPSGSTGISSYLLDEAGITGRLSSSVYCTPGQRTRMGYDFRVSAGHRVVPSQGARDIPVAFIVNANSDVPTEMLALQAEGRARVVVEGELDESTFVATTRVTLTNGLAARIRLSELVFHDGVHRIAPDAVVGAPVARSSAADEAVAVAARALGARNIPRLSSTPVSAHGVKPPAPPMPEELYPSVDQRIGAVFRLWAAIDDHAPYRELIGEDWDQALRRGIPKVQQATDATAYHLAVAEMVTHIHDSHGLVRSPVLGQFFGTAAPPVRVRVIEGLPVITGFRDESAARAAGAEIGDVITEVDGEPVTQRMKRYSAYVCASTPQAAERDTVDRRSVGATTGGVLFGPPESVAVVAVRTASGEAKTLRLPRKASFTAALEQRTGDVLKLLSGNIGYADLDRLPLAMVDEMFERFRDTMAIILDMRGYPRGVPQASIASRVTDREAVPAAMFYTTVPPAPSDASDDIETLATLEMSRQRFHGTSRPYRGKTVMLIDERTQSAAEHLGLFLETANGTKFVGSETAGANGNVMTVRLPGQIAVSFSGLGVKHADGRQLQRIGLVPDLRVTPTLEGIRAGRDEVLDAAIAYLTRGR